MRMNLPKSSSFGSFKLHSPRSLVEGQNGELLLLLLVAVEDVVLLFSLFERPANKDGELATGVSNDFVVQPVNKIKDSLV